MATVQVGEPIRRLEADGWVLVRTTGGHQIFRYHTKPGTVTVAGKPSEQLTEGTWIGIQRQAGWRS